MATEVCEEVMGRSEELPVVDVALGSGEGENVASEDARAGGVSMAAGLDSIILFKSCRRIHVCMRVAHTMHEVQR